MAEKQCRIHINFLLEEEFNADPTFLRPFILAAGKDDGSFETESVRHSVRDEFGEADLIVVYNQRNSDTRIAILIEDKTRACFQPDQPARYHKHGKAGIEKMLGQLWACLVAAATYVDLKRGHGFDATVTLEQIKDCLSVMEPKRCEFKARVIRDATTRSQ
jgi:hypothetical protein